MKGQLVERDGEDERTRRGDLVFSLATFVLTAAWVIFLLLFGDER